ncbi:hypothetical protein TBK1r_48960 [Stieleria magnilauensis]|uniref:Uncharacterized protein n=1 Tax=Stieleria magnilauensis TaxID=2527963 RepID=A0ABX5XV99_9BACT|nr:hypothetical protein TBK1r_48960 [Planctomycetes bacterium TBK1r]
METIAARKSVRSLYNWNGGHCGVELARWPLPRLPGWIEWVNKPVSENERETSEADGLGKADGRKLRVEKWGGQEADRQENGA